MTKYSMDSVFIPEEDKVVMTSTYLDQPVEKLFEVRRKLRPTVNELSLLCPTCYQPLLLAGRMDQTFYFRHVKDSEDCPIKTTSHLTKEEIEAMKYNGQKEGKRHKENKQYIASMLERDKGFKGVHVEKTFREENSTGIAKQWRRPDVSASHVETDKKIAFELQVSTTFIDVIVERERFYRENGAFIIWVFLNFEEKRFTELDIFYANKLNAFILDEEAKMASSKCGELVLKCHYKDYFVQESGGLVEVVEKDEEELVPVSQLSFDDVTGKLFFFDSNNRKRNVERQAETRRTEIRIEKERRAAEERARKAREAKANRQVSYGSNYWQPTYYELEITENKGLSDANFKALSKSKKYENLKCENCENTSRFYDKACFIFCSKCRKEVKY